MTEQIFKQDAKQIVDLIFDTKLFKEDVTRDNMNAFEEFIQFSLSARFETYKKTHKFLESLEKSENK